VCTSAGVDPQLPVDVALVHQGVEDIEHAVDVPDLGVVPQELDLFLRLLGRLAAVLAERLELSGKRRVQNIDVHALAVSIL